MENQESLDLSRVFELEPHGPDTYVGESPRYSWGRIFGGLVVAQALWAAIQSVKPEYIVHSLHTYFILGGNFEEPVRYEVDRVRNGRSFSTRRVVARQSAGAILTLACSFQVKEAGGETQSTSLPAGLPDPEQEASEYDAGALRVDVETSHAPPRSRMWARYPALDNLDPRVQPCTLAYLSDLNPMTAIHASLPEGAQAEEGQGASLDHAMWFHRPGRADDWVLLDMEGHGMIGTRGLATGRVFDRAGAHLATVAQEGLLRPPRKPVKA
ncbi:MAG: thioesterase family protein [Myxococcota bacterium]|nr:thioesterase family protein [Myxococcota bacterium]